MTPPIDANTRELRLARRALRTAQTHLRNAVGLVCMSEETRAECAWRVEEIQLWVLTISRLEHEANAHLSSKVKSRKRGRK